MTQAAQKPQRGLTSGLVQTLLKAWQGLDGLALLKAVLRTDADVNIAV
ncbi:MAG: hypothetical protein JKY27_08340, partial [Magnetovibrio sp.]|nr:hypothetical protein [Magnetovibrio sp.]